MTALVLTDRQAVLAAVVEYDAVGRRAFLDKSGYGPAREYYLMVDGKRYDSKAIAGVAYGHEHPDHGPLLHREFSGGEATVKRVLKDLGFTVVRGSGNDTPSGALVLVENEVTMGHEYDFWADDTGVQYHFPNVYRNRVQTGLPFIYYRGVRRQGNKRGPAGYFGTGTVGEIRPDPDQPHGTPNRLRRWYRAVDDYVPFVMPVPAKVGQAPYEPISGALGWRTGVREISQAVYEAILTAAGLRPLPPLPVAAKVSEVQPTESEPGDLMATRRLSAGAPGTGARAPRSPRAKQIGDWAEELVYRRLCATLPEQARDTVDWVAHAGMGYRLQGRGWRGHRHRGQGHYPGAVHCHRADRK